MEGKGIMPIFGKFEGKSQYVQKHYLLWKLRHVLDMEIKWRLNFQIFIF